MQAWRLRGQQVGIQCSLYVHCLAPGSGGACFSFSMQIDVAVGAGLAVQLVTASFVQGTLQIQTAHGCLIPDS